jgi:hypothetical protein
MRLLHDIVLQVLQVGMPAVVRESVLIPIFKKGDAADPNNYRGIQLISVLRKVVALVLAHDVGRREEPRLLEWQCGFRPLRSCSDQIFVLRKLSELSVEWQQRLYVAFVDLAKAFDSIPRPALWAVLRARGIPEQLLQCVIGLHTDTRCSVRVGSSLSPQFSMEYGVQQGCPLAAVLFNVFFDHVVREALAACPDAGVTVRRRGEMGADLRQPTAGQRSCAAMADLTVPVLLLADDLAFVAPTAEQLQRFMAAFESACQRWGLVISASKTQLLLVGGSAALSCEDCGQLQPERDMLVCSGCQRGWHTACLRPPLPAVPSGDWRCPTCAVGGGGRDAWRPPVVVRGQQLEWVDSFKYLGSCFSGNGSLEVELDRRIRLAAHAFRRLERLVFRQRCISLHTRIQVYNCMVTSVLLYGSESWSLTAPQLQRFEVFHHCRLRMILGSRARRRAPPPAAAASPAQPQPQPQPLPQPQPQPLPPTPPLQYISNDELLSRCHTTSIATLLARRQLRWLGHLGRMDDMRLSKQVLHATLHRPGRSRRLGRPRRDLCATYSDLVRDHMGVAAVRARTGAGVDRRATWLTLCRNKERYRNTVNTVLAP